MKEVVQNLFALFGLRLQFLRNCPRGTEVRLYEDVRSLLSQNAEPAVALDVGANFGHVTADILGIFPSLPVHAFEPSPATFGQLKTRFAGHPRVICHAQAISARPGELPFQVRPDEPGLARLADAPGADTVMVEVETVDRFLQREGIAKVALLKTDTEGREMDVFAGAADALAAGRILSILVECAPGEGTHRHVPLRRIADHLEPFGYRLFGLYDFGYRKSGEMHFCNALFKHEQVWQTLNARPSPAGGSSGCAGSPGGR